MTDDLDLALAPISSIDELATEWRTIDIKGKTSFFTSWFWIGTWLRTMPRDFNPLLLRVMLGERTIALAVLVRRQVRRRGLFNVRQIHFNATGDPRFDCCFIEHNGFASALSDQHGLWRAFATWFESGAAAADECVIGGLPSCVNLTSSSLFQHVQHIPAYVVDLGVIAAAGGDPVAQLSRNSRQQLRRSMRLCSEVGPLGIDTARDAEEALCFFSAMKPLHIAHWQRRGKPHAYVNPYFEVFHRSLIRSGVSNDAIELLRVRAGSLVLGYLYNFRRAGTVYAYQSGFGAFDERWRVGYVSHALAIRHAARRGDVAYDFMAGSNRLKTSFASREYEMGWHVLQQSNLSLRTERRLHRIFIKLRAYHWRKCDSRSINRLVFGHRSHAV